MEASAVWLQTQRDTDAQPARGVLTTGGGCGGGREHFLTGAGAARCDTDGV